MDHTSLANTPAAAPPEGQASNFVDPPSQKGAMIAVSTVMMVLTLAFVSVRVFSSFRITRRPGAEDWLCLVAVVLTFAYIGIILRLSHVSRHMWDVPQIWFTEDYWKIRFAGNTFQALAYFTSRIPILLLYLRFFGRKRGVRMACYFAIVAAFGTYITSIPLLSYFCTPPPGGDWGSLDVFAKCKKLLNWAMIQGSLDIALNIYIFVLPLPVVLGLHMERKKMLGVLTIFLTGLLAVICSALGLYYRYKLSFTPDVNWNEGAFICMSVVETNVAIICSCMPACASFSRHMLEHSTFIISLRSAFSRNSIFSTTKSTAKKSKFSDAPSSASGHGHSQHLVPDSRATQPDNRYIELQETNGYGWTNGDCNVETTAHADHADAHRSNGIMKSVSVEIV